MMKRKFILPAILIVYVSVCLPVLAMARGDLRVPEKYHDLPQHHTHTPVTAKATSSFTATLNNGLSLLIVTALGIGILKAFEKGKKESVPVILEKIY